MDDLIQRMEKFTRDGSGWIFESTLVYLKQMIFGPLLGISYVQLT